MEIKIEGPSVTVMRIGDGFVVKGEGHHNYDHERRKGKAFFGGTKVHQTLDDVHTSIDEFFKKDAEVEARVEEQSK